MTAVKFPKRNDDGTFMVVAQFTISDRAIVSMVNDYLKAWVRANGTWIRIWRSDSIVEERLDFYADFLDEPQAEIEGSSLRVVLKGQPPSTRWKDWAVYMVNDVSNVFPELKFEGFTS